MRASVLFFLLGLFTFSCVYGQVKIGDNPQNIDPSAVLELESTTMALIITRVTTTQMEAIVPSQGALVYNTETACVHYYNGAEWVNLCEGVSINVTADPIINDVSTISIATNPNGGTNFEVIPNSISGDQIIDGSIFGVDINNNSIGPDKLANNSVGKFKLSENAVGPFAIDRDSLPLSFFINDVPFLTAGDLTVVSDDIPNAISIGADNGAFYNEQPLVDAIAQNASDIALDGDTNANNEIQTLSLDNGNELTISGANMVTLPTADGSDTRISAGANIAIMGNGTATTPYVVSSTNELQDLEFDAITNILTLSNPATSTNEVDLSALAGGGGNPTDELITASVLNGNLLTLTEGGNDFDIDLTGLGGGTGSTELVDGITLTGTGTAGDRFKIEPSATNGQFLQTDSNGDVIWDDLPSGTGGAVSSDGLTITGDGVATDLSVLDGGITPIKIEPSGTNGQFLRTDAAGDVIWDDLPTGTGGAVNSDGVTITGDGVATDLAVLDGGITPIKIEPSANINEVLTTDGSGAVVWAAGGGGLTISSDTPNSIVTGTDGGILYDDGDSDDTNEIELPIGGSNGNVLSTDGSGTYSWVADNAGLSISTDTPNSIVIGTDGGILYDDGDSDDTNEIELPTGGSNGDVLSTDGAGTYSWVTDSNLSISGDTPNSIGTGTDGGILYVDGDSDDTNEIELPTGGSNGNVLSTDGAGTYSWVVNGNSTGSGNVTGNGITVSGGANATFTNVGLSITDNAVTTSKILNDNVTPAKIVEGADGEVLTTNSTGDVVWAPPSPGIIAMGKIQDNGSVIKATGVISTFQSGPGTYTVNLDPLLGLTDDNYIINATAFNAAAFVVSIKVSSQSQTAFTVQITNSGGLFNSAWFFTITDF